jgi:urease accessory protein
MGGAMPVTAMQGLLSGLGHPILGLDHFAAMIAVGFVAAAHRAGTALICGFVLAMIVGAAMHVQGVTVPASEILVAGSVLALGLAMQLRVAAGLALALFAMAGLINGYALGETIAGAQPSPLFAYFIGLAVVQAGIAWVTMWLARFAKRETTRPIPFNVRIVSAVVMVIGLAVLIAEIFPRA